MTSYFPHRQLNLSLTCCQHKLCKGVDCCRQVIDRIEIWSLRWNKKRCLPSCGHVRSKVPMHHMNVNKKHREKARWELHEDVRCCFDKIQQATTNKPAGEQPLTYHLKIQSGNTNKTCEKLLIKQELIQYWRFSIDSYTCTLPRQPTKKKDKLCAGRIYSLEDQPVGIVNID